MIKPLFGTIRGSTIELGHNPGLPEGQRVHVVVSPAPLAFRAGGEVESAEANANGTREDGNVDWWTEDDDRILAEIYADRHRDLRPEVKD